MNCRNCGAAVRAGESFCHVCAMPVNMNPNAAVEDITNPATNEFMKQNDRVVQVPSQEQESPYLKASSYERVVSAEVRPDDVQTDTKKFETRDGNDRVKATAMNFISFAAIVGIAIWIFYLLYEYVFKQLF